MFSTLGLAIATMPTFNCAIHTKEGIHTPHTFVGVQKRARAVSTGSCDRSKVTHGPKAGLVPIGGHASSLLGGRVCRLIRLLALGPLRRTLPVPFRVLLFAPPSAPSPELGLAGAVPSGRVVLSPFL
ncbi:unnamed protein product [Durusdinium trenchii]|uniref:Secreted protein n=1 Tax=Durusdinium trenchii TaxID=1381693 RepID=A0ABP0LPK5_9DINO